MRQPKRSQRKVIDNKTTESVEDCAGNQKIEHDPAVCNDLAALYEPILTDTTKPDTIISNSPKVVDDNSR